MIDNEALTAYLNDLNRLVVSEEPVTAALDRVATLSSTFIEACDSCGVSLVEVDRVVTRAASNDRADRVDSIQYDTGVGPCLQAIADGKPVDVESFEGENRWPEFIDRAKAEGIRASYSVPLIVDEEIVGSINFYSYDRPFSADERRMGELFATQAAVALHNAKTVSGVRDLVGQLREAVESRDVIGQAKGILMARHSLSAEEAFDELRTRSQAANRKLREVAMSVVEEATAGAVERGDR